MSKKTKQQNSATASRSRHSTRERTVRLTTHRQGLILTPPCQAVEAVLTAGSLVTENDPEHGYRIARRVHSLVQPNWAVPTAGLTPIAHYVALYADYEVSTANRHYFLGPNVPVMALGRMDTHVTDFVGHRSHGLIRHAAGQVDVAWIVAQIALAFPDATIAIVTGSQMKAQRFCERIRRWIPKATFVTARLCPENVDRVMVATYYGLGHPEVGLDWRQIVIALDAEEAVGEKPQYALYFARDGRMFAFLPLNRTPAPRNWDKIVATFGLDEVQVPRHGYRARQVQVAVMKIAGGPDLPRNADALRLKQIGVWHNPVRNRRLAALAKALVAGDQTQLNLVCPATATFPTRPMSTLLLAETIEHALELAERLREWPLITDWDVITSGLSSPQQQIITERRVMPGTTGNAIVTVGALASMNLESTDAIIWAGGGKCVPPLLADKLVCPADQDHHLLLIDCADQHHPQLRRWSRLRLKSYVEQGWFPVGVDPMIGKIRHFLAHRPGRPR